MRKLLFLTSVIVILTIALMHAQDNSTTSSSQDSTSSNSMDPAAAGHYNNAVQAMKAEQYDAALQSIDSSLMIAKDYRSYLLQGQANLKLGMIPQAIQSFNESIKLNPESDIAWMAVGNTYLAAKQYGEAENAFKKAAEVTKNPDLKKSAEESIQLAVNSTSIDLYNEGNELYKQEKYEEAIKKYDAALATSKDHKYYYQKGLAYIKLNKTKEAEAELKSAIAANDSFDLGYLALASLQTANKDFDGALASYQKALTVTTNENLKGTINTAISKTYVVAGNSFHKDKKYDAAIEWIQKGIAAAASDDLYLSLAKALIEKKKYNDAISALDSAKAIQSSVTDGAIAYYKGLAHLNKGEDGKAIESFNTALNDATYKKASQSQIDYIKAKQKGAKPKK